MQVGKEVEVRVESIQELELPDKSKRVLGEGAYASVKLVFHKRIKQWFALKQIDLRKSVQRLTKEKKLELVKREIKLHKNLKHKHVIRLYDYFKMGDRVFLLMELASGGNLFKHIKKNRSFDEKTAILYFNQVVLGVEYLHEKNVIHRDLKPENILINEEGELKICDFGWSVSQDVDMRQTFCGTYEYMAPEILDNTGYDKKVDIWSLGILLFELLHGYSPFKGKQMMEVFSNIKRSFVKYKSGISNGVKNLINGILRPNPNHRLTIEEIRNHDIVMKYVGGEKIFGVKKSLNNTNGMNVIKDLKTNFNQAYELMNNNKTDRTERNGIDAFPSSKRSVSNPRRDKAKPPIKIEGKLKEEHSYAASFKILPHGQKCNLNRTNSTNLNRTKRFIPKLDLMAKPTETSKYEDLSTLRAYKNQIPKGYSKRNRSLGSKIQHNSLLRERNDSRSNLQKREAKNSHNNSFTNIHKHSFSRNNHKNRKVFRDSSQKNQENILKKKCFNSVDICKKSRRKGVNMGILNNMLNNLSNRENCEPERKGQTDRYHFRPRSIANGDSSTSRREYTSRNQVMNTKRGENCVSHNGFASVGRRKDNSMNYMFTQRGVRNTERYESSTKNKTMVSGKTRAVSYDIKAKPGHISFMEQPDFPKKPQPKQIPLGPESNSRILVPKNSNNRSMNQRTNNQVLNNIWSNLQNHPKKSLNVRASYDRNDSYFFKESYNLLKTSKDKLTKKIKKNSYYKMDKENSNMIQKPVIVASSSNENSTVRVQTPVSSLPANKGYLRRQKDSQNDNILKKAYFYKRKSKQSNGFMQAPREVGRQCFGRKVGIDEDNKPLHFY